MQSLSPVGGESSCRWYPAQDDDLGLSWAHVSGWAQLNGTRRSLSCVIPLRNQLPALRSVLPALSDVLTECGFPWEVIVVDCASSDGTERVFRSWCELPGYRLIALDDVHDRAGATVLGLEAARGDAVILMDTCAAHPLSMLQEMVMRWENGALALHATRNAHTGHSIVRATRDAGGSFDHTVPRPADGDANLVLLDRTVVRELLR